MAPVDRPSSLSDVKSWLAEHPDPDPATLAPHVGQRAAGRRAAMRALGLIGSDRALEVFGEYAASTYSDAELNELHRAWGRFDRDRFARTMFGGSPSLRLGMCRTIEGIQSIPGLRELHVVFDGSADLTPLTGCTDLRVLDLGVEGDPGLEDASPIAALPALIELQVSRTTRRADLSILADTPVQRLRVALDGGSGAFLSTMPALRRVVVSGESSQTERPVPVDPELSDVVFTLVDAGVEVVLWRHERSWVPDVVARAEVRGDVVVVDRSGFIGLTRDPASAEDLARRLFLNLLP